MELHDAVHLSWRVHLLREVQHSRQKTKLDCHDINVLLHTVQWKELFAQDECKYFIGLLSQQLISGHTLWALAQMGFLMLSVAAAFLQMSKGYKPWPSPPRSPWSYPDTLCFPTQAFLGSLGDFVGRFPQACMFWAIFNGTSWGVEAIQSEWGLGTGRDLEILCIVKICTLQWDS